MITALGANDRAVFDMVAGPEIGFVTLVTELDARGAPAPKIVEPTEHYRKAIIPAMAQPGASDGVGIVMTGASAVLGRAGGTWLVSTPRRAPQRHSI